MLQKSYTYVAPDSFPLSINQSVSQSFSVARSTPADRCATLNPCRIKKSILYSNFPNRDTHRGSSRLGLAPVFKHANLDWLSHV